MHRHTIYPLHRVIILLFIPAVTAVFFACGGGSSQPGLVDSPKKMDKKVSEIISDYINRAAAADGKLNDSITLDQAVFTQIIYSEKQFEPIWSSKENWLSAGDSLLDFIHHAKQWGLFPENYHSAFLDTLRNEMIADSAAKTSRRDAGKWAAADIVLTNALVQLFHDVKLGRLQNDSVMKRADSVLSRAFVSVKFREVLQSGSLKKVLASMEPAHAGYHALKAGIKKFLDSADFRNYTHLPFPYKDTLKFKKLLLQRLSESGFISPAVPVSDTAQLKEAIKKFQLSKKLKADGKAGGETVRLLNNNDNEKFYRIAITLDRFKMLPAHMPEKYIWVNLPAYQLQLWEVDSVKITSKVVVGKPHTRTPVLTSSVYEMITYPKWTIPNSIIVKDILPALKRNPGYLARKGFSLIRGGETVDPYSVDWSKYSKAIPYQVVQGSGDANALGVMKFNFKNGYQVYMHDTNERYLFSRAARSLSHGCVRVQEWNKMANYFILNDDEESFEGDTLQVTKDSLLNWLQRKEKHTITLKNKIPVYFRYFSCEGKNGSIIFYDDIYGEDALLREKYYSRK